MINWKVRIKQKWWWISMVAAVLALAQAILAPFGIKIDFDFINEYAVGVINAVFAVLILMGISIDPTTEGVSDSYLAMAYEIPKMKDGTYLIEEAEDPEYPEDEKHEEPDADSAEEEAEAEQEVEEEEEE